VKNKNNADFKVSKDGDILHLIRMSDQLIEIAFDYSVSDNQTILLILSREYLYLQNSGLYLVLNPSEILGVQVH
jgi:hypothetical protein